MLLLVSVTSRLEDRLVVRQKAAGLSVTATQKQKELPAALAALWLAPNLRAEGLGWQDFRGVGSWLVRCHPAPPGCITAKHPPPAQYEPGAGGSGEGCAAGEVLPSLGMLGMEASPPSC